MSTKADELVAAYILRVYRERHEMNDGTHTTHLAGCAEASVTNPDTQDGTYGCETGCDYYTLTATIACPHGMKEDYEYGDFGMIAFLLKDLEREAAP